MPKRRRKRPAPGLLGWASLLLLILITFLGVFWFLRPLKENSLSPLKRPTIYIPPLRYKKIPARKKSSPSSRASRAAAPRPSKPLAAIIIDDMGLNPRIERRFFKLGLTLNFSFLPFNPYTKPLAREAHRLGFEVLVHIPLVSKNGTHPRGLITMNMGIREVKRRVREDILAVPYAIGANHHEGSWFTTDPRRTRWVLEEVKALGLFYVDSRTTPDTVVPKVARAIGLPYAERRVFLDHTFDAASIKKEINRFISRAKRTPTVAIGHPHEITLKVLRQEKTRLLRELDLVPISVFIERTRGKK